MILECQNYPKHKNHIFYLHGRIVELQGAEAESPIYGKYKYQEIIDSLSTTGTVHHEVRSAGVDFNTFCTKISNQIDSLIFIGVKPECISVIGASKGGIMSMNISTINSNPINYILLGANNESIQNQYQFQLHGRVLGIYEKTDSIAGLHYDFYQKKSKKAIKINSLEINTSLGHGFLYKPMEAWLKPTREWINIHCY